MTDTPIHTARDEKSNAKSIRADPKPLAKSPRNHKPIIKSIAKSTAISEKPSTSRIRIVPDKPQAQSKKTTKPTALKMREANKSFSVNAPSKNGIKLLRIKNRNNKKLGIAHCIFWDFKRSKKTWGCVKTSNKNICPS